MKQRTP